MGRSTGHERARYGGRLSRIVLILSHSGTVTCRAMRVEKSASSGVQSRGGSEQTRKFDFGESQFRSIDYRPSKQKLGKRFATGKREATGLAK